jgi:hypothetical protein
MKLVVTIDAPEKEIWEAVAGIPPSFLRDQGVSPVRLIAVALKQAYEKHLREKEKIQ